MVYLDCNTIAPPEQRCAGSQKCIYCVNEERIKTTCP
jgi:hypothetical protein